MFRLSTTEKLVLTMVAVSEGETAEVGIIGQLRNRFNYSISECAVLVTIKKLEQKGVVTSCFSITTTQRKNKRKRFYTSRKNLDPIAMETK